MQIKQGDMAPLTFTVSTDLTGATCRLLVRHLTLRGDLEVLSHTVTDAENGKIEHVLDGTWQVGNHYIEVEIDRGGQKRTAPSVGFLVVFVGDDLDQAAA